MLKITTQTNGRSTVLKLEGVLRDQWLVELRGAVEAARSKQIPLRLDLTDVTFADAPGIALLRELVNDGVQIKSCSDFLAASLGMERP